MNQEYMWFVPMRDGVYFDEVLEEERELISHWSPVYFNEM